ncbi:MAG: LCP family protein [Coriobacteriia bacterium]|jgi:LCP family protein required for cell wall assembly|nr:LCP family protein [Coriobacteriia bacterium]
MRQNDRASEHRSAAPIEAAPRTRAGRQRRRKRTTRIVLGVAIALGVLLVAGAAWSFFFLRGIEGRMQQTVKSDEAVQVALTKKEPEQPFNLLLLGSDARLDEEAARADTIIVARVDPADHRVWMLSIPRDTRVEIPGHGVNKINAATAMGGPSLMIDTVEEYLGLPINHYMEVDFSGFQGIVDAMGGIYIDVDVEINDAKAASHSPGRRARHIAPGYQLLDGEYALTYVRSRNFPDSDFTRMRHQQNFFKALAKQSSSWGNLLKLPKMAKELSKYVVTDMSMSQVLDLAQAFKGVGTENIQAATLPGEWKSPYVWVDEEMKNHLVSQMLAGGDIEAKDVPEVEKAPEDITVSVRNGAGISGVAAQAAARLQARGFQVEEVGNANQFVYEETLIVYRDDESAAQTVASALPKGRLVPSRGMYAFSTDVLVVVGSDWSDETNQ